MEVKEAMKIELGIKVSQWMKLNSEWTVNSE